MDRTTSHRSPSHLVVASQRVSRPYLKSNCNFIPSVLNSETPDLLRGKGPLQPAKPRPESKHGPRSLHVSVAVELVPFPSWAESCHPDPATTADAHGERRSAHQELQQCLVGTEYPNHQKATVTHPQIKPEPGHQGTVKNRDQSEPTGPDKPATTKQQ